MNRVPRMRLRRKSELLKGNLISLAVTVQESFMSAITAIKSRDKELAASVIEGDREIDRIEIEIEETCLEILALHQPVALDLRLITGALKIINQLERIGDLAVNIAQAAVILASESHLDIPGEYYFMAQRVENMLKKAIKSFVNEDEDVAFEVLADDDEVDMMKHKLHRNFEDRVNVELNRRHALTQLFLVSRHLERIADHSTNIAEDVIYMITGEIVRHGHGASK
ncbi:MAG: phosphate signaling complex protein PhoU [Syntrophaceae bacterium]|nr:phosphate signaling complex protein PhoU [Syntrophaceae bacterium]